MINILDVAQTCVGIVLIRRVARSLQYGEGYYRGVGAKPPPAVGLGAVLGRNPQLSKILYFFGKNNLILGLF